jgi:hypothetical protein
MKVRVVGTWYGKILLYDIQPQEPNAPGTPPLYITLPVRFDERPGEGLVHRLEPLGVTFQRMASSKIHVFLKTQIEHDHRDEDARKVLKSTEKCKCMQMS